MFTPQEQKFIEYLKSHETATWDDLRKLCKNADNTQIKTVKRVVSDIKAKFKSKNQNLPWTAQISEATPIQKEPEQKIIELRRTIGGNVIDKSINIPDAQIDFKMDNVWKTIKTKSGTIKVSTPEWEIFEHLLINAEKQVSIHDLKEVLFKNFGSKTPANWAEVISRTLTKLRKNIPELKKDERLLTVTSTNTTFYMIK